MAPAAKEALVIVVDANESSRTGDPSFLQRASECVARILQRKIISQSKDDVGLVVCGGSVTDNQLQDDTDYANINVAVHLATTSWDAVKFARETLPKTDGPDGDWLSAIVVALDHLRSHSKVKKYTQHKLALISDLTGGVSEDNLQAIVAGMKSMDVDLTFIGGQGLKEEKFSQESGMMSSAAVASHICEQMDGTQCTIEEALKQLVLFPRRATRSVPWNIDLEIGPDVKIPVSFYIRIRATKPASWNKVLKDSPKDISETREKGNSKNIDESNENGDSNEKDDSRQKAPTGGVVKETTYHNTDERQTEAPTEELIRAYRYGSSLVPFSEADLKAMDYDAGDKSVKVIGFTKAENIGRHIFQGDGTSLVCGRKGDRAAAVALSALARAMHERDMVAVARKVRTAKSKAVLVALYPYIFPDKQCLCSVELCFAEGLRNLFFMPLPRTKAQSEADAEDAAINALLDAGEIMQSEACSEMDEEDLPVNPYLQRLYTCMAERAINPNSTINVNVEDDILCDLHMSGQEWDAALKQMKQVFPLEEVKAVVKKERPVMADVEEAGPSEKKPRLVDSQEEIPISLARLAQGPIKSIGTLTTEDDFRTMLDQGANFTDVLEQMQTVILKMASDELTATRAAKALRCAREACMKRSAVDDYNHWAAELKKQERKAPHFWKLVVEEKLGPVTKAESESGIEEEEVQKFYLECAPEVKVEEPMQDMDADDLLSEL